jgi:non-heme chloroperoxidase
MSEHSRRTFLATTAASAAALALAQIVRTPGGHAAEVKAGSVTTNDGVTLRYAEAGSGTPIVCIPGWSQTAAQFKGQIDGLSERYRVIAVDMRGHGESDKPNHGYTIQRLAKDVHELIHALNLTDVVAMGHSMGCSVMWSYWELWGPERLSRLVLIDQMPMITANPIWSQQEKEDAGAIFDPTSLYATINKLAGPEGVPATEGFIGAMFTKSYPRDEVAWVVKQNLKMPRRYAADLLFNHSCQDWRALIPRIDIPTLVVGGRASTVPWKSQVWIGNQIKGARTEIFEENEGGNHFMFMENPAKFNRIVTEFIG